MLSIQLNTIDNFYILSIDEIVRSLHVLIFTIEFFSSYKNFKSYTFKISS